MMPGSIRSQTPGAGGGMPNQMNPSGGMPNQMNPSGGMPNQMNPLPNNPAAISQMRMSGSQVSNKT